MTHHHQQREKILQSCYHKFYLPTAFHSAFQLLAQTATFAFIGKSGYTLGFAQRIAHSGSQGEARRFGWGWYHYPRSVSHVSETLRGQVSERQTLPLLGLGWVYSRRTQRACGTAMRLCASLSRGVAAPLGCVIFFASAEIEICTSCAQGLSACARWGWYHYPRRALRAAETPDVHLSKRLICRFLRLPSSTPCAVTFSANIQISLSVISVANAFALWYDKSHKSGLFGDEGEPE